MFTLSGAIDSRALLNTSAVNRGVALSFTLPTTDSGFSEFVTLRSIIIAGENLGWRLETIVFIELLRRNRPINRDIYYYRSSNGVEADFVVSKNNVVEEIYQVSYDISKEKHANEN